MRDMEKMEKTVKFIQRICIIGIVALALIAAGGLCILFFPPASSKEPARPQNTATAPQHDAGQETSGAAALARRTDYLPDGALYGCRLSVTSFKGADGKARSLDEYRGGPLVLMFWASWCPYCDEALKHSGEYARALEAYPGARLVLIDKLDPGRDETVQRAQEHLAQLGVPFESLYDEGLAAYEAYGLKQVPTLLVLDEDGYLRHMTTQAPKSGEELALLLDDALSGGAAGTMRFVRERMTGEDGGIFTSFASGNAPSGRDVLSESQGLMMQIALESGDRELFDLSYRCAQERLEQDGIFCWYVTEAGERANANALIDDLRIYKALRGADARWGGYAEQAAALARAIYKRNVSRGHLTGFYDFSQRKAGGTLPLFYIDMEALRLLADDVPAFARVAQEAERVLLEGRISDAFPLYYSSYDYAEKRYSGEDMNTAEALMTLYHAAKAGVASQEAIDWLRRQVAAGTLAARYSVDGNPVRGYEYDSTAAYALAALIGAEAGDASLYTAARNRMEKYHVTEQTELRGSFSDRADGSDIIAFDQLLPLLVYTGAKNIVFEHVR